MNSGDELTKIFTLRTVSTSMQTLLDIKSLTNPIASEAVQEVQCVYDLGVQTDFEYWSVKIDDFFLCPSNEINFIDSDKDVR